MDYADLIARLQRPWDETEGKREIVCREAADALGSLTRELEETREAAIAARQEAFNNARFKAVCQQIVDKYDDVNLSHQDFRIGAFEAAIDAFGDDISRARSEEDETR